MVGGLRLPTAFLCLACSSCLLAIEPVPAITFQSQKDCIKYIATYLALPTDESTIFKLALDTSTAAFPFGAGEGELYLMHTMHWFVGHDDALGDCDGNVPIILVLQSPEGFRIVGEFRGWVPGFIGAVRDGKVHPQVLARHFVDSYSFYYLTYEWTGDRFECVEQSELISIYDEEPVIHKRRPNQQ